MAKVGINTGSSANAGDGSSLRTGANIINANFNEVYDLLGNGTTLSVGIVTTDNSGNAYNLKGDGSALTGLTASQIPDISAAKLTSGTLPDARFPAALPAISGANLTNLPGIEGISTTGVSYFNHLDITGITTFAGNVNITNDQDLVLADENRIIFTNGFSGVEKDAIYWGDTGQVLKIYNDTTYSRIVNGTSGGLIVQAANDIYIKPQGGESGIDIYGDGGVVLYNDNSAKLSTLGTGATVFGTVYSSNGAVHQGICTASTFSGNGSQLTSVTGGLSEVDQWYLTADQTVTPQVLTYIGTNAARAGTANGNFAVKGTGMTLTSSGSDRIWSFPSTGYWQVSYKIMGDILTAGITLNYGWKMTTDNSTYNSHIQESYSQFDDTIGGLIWNLSGSNMFRITDITNQKIQFWTWTSGSAGGNYKILGGNQTSDTADSAHSASGWNFVKFCDI